MLQKKSFFSVEKIISADFFSFCGVWKTSGSILIRSTRCFDKYCASFEIISFGPARSMITTSQKKAPFSIRKKFGQFFLVLPSLADPGNSLVGSTWCFGSHCASYEIFSVTLRTLLKIQVFLRKGYFPRKKFCWANFFSIYAN